MKNYPIIDYEKLAEASNYYKSLGYQEISVPWIIQYEAYSVTRPTERKEFYCLNGYLNASGEQSFIELLLGGEKIKKHFCITPCFRDEPIIDNFHQKYFIKLELIHTVATLRNLKKVIADAVTLFSMYTTVTVVRTSLRPLAFDIVDEKTGIELGSYGIRTYKKIKWIYGTGLALPRLDSVINLK